MVAASVRPETSPTLTGAGESSTSTSTGSTSTSPTQGKPICDKSLDFTQLPALPDFKSFQKPVCEQPQQQNGLGTAAKVAIPRLASGIKAQQQQRSPQSSPKKQVKNAKYKAIQPKPQPCDNASYNPQTSADIRSQGVLHNVDRFKERKSSDDDCDTPVFPLPRERLESISNVDKDAMDEYLGKLPGLDKTRNLWVAQCRHRDRAKPKIMFGAILYKLLTEIAWKTDNDRLED